MTLEDVREMKMTARSVHEIIMEEAREGIVPLARGLHQNLSTLSILLSLPTPLCRGNNELRYGRDVRIRQLAHIVARHDTLQVKLTTHVGNVNVRAAGIKRCQILHVHSEASVRVLLSTTA